MQKMLATEKIKIQKMKKEHELQLKQEHRNEILEQKIVEELQAAEKEMRQNEMEAAEKFRKLNDKLSHQREEIQNTKKRQAQEENNKMMAVEILHREGYKNILEKNSVNEEIVEKSSNFLKDFLISHKN